MNGHTRDESAAGITGGVPTVALVIFHADPARGGAERYTFDLARSLATRGENVSVLSSSFGSAPEGARCVTLQASSPTRLGAYRRFLDSLDEHLRTRQYDVIHAMLPVRRCDIYHPHAGLAAQALVRGHLKHRSRIEQAAAQLLNRLNRKRRAFATVERELLTGPKPPIVLCLSEYVKRSVREYYSLNEERLVTLFNGIDITRFDSTLRPEARNDTRQRLGLADDRIIALIIAQDFQRKGLREAIAAISRVADERLTLVVVGKQNPAKYRAMAHSLGISQRVIFAGPTSAPYDFYQAADFFVLPTRHDPCSLVVLEALAMGLPVISTRHNGACEIMTDGQEGFVLPDAGNVDALATAMRAILHPGPRQMMREACLRLRPALSHVTHLEKLMQIYRDVM